MPRVKLQSLYDVSHEDSLINNENKSVNLKDNTKDSDPYKFSINSLDDENVKNTKVDNNSNKITQEKLDNLINRIESNLSKSKSKIENKNCDDAEFNFSKEYGEDIEELDNPKKERRHKKRAALSSKENDSQNHIQIVLDDDNVFGLNIPKNIFNIEIKKDQYNVYVENSKSFIIVDKDILRIVCKNLFFEINRENGVYNVSTNQSIKSDSSVELDDIVKDDDTISFIVNNPYKIYVDDKKFIKVESSKETKELLDISDNNSLVISEKDGKVFLPYKAADVSYEYTNNKDKYDSVNSVIEKKYTLPMTNYKHSITSRYKEAYNLMRYKEKKSVKDSVMLGLELMFEFNLHPAIITACNTLEELDIYLDCLDDNELDKFSCFKIIYNSLPVISSKHKKGLQGSEV